MAARVDCHVQSIYMLHCDFGYFARARNRGSGSTEETIITDRL